MSTAACSSTDYDQCNTLLMSAFFCVTGRTALDDRLRKAIEDVLIELIRRQEPAITSNVIPFCPRRQRPTENASL